MSDKNSIMDQILNRHDLACAVNREVLSFHKDTLERVSAAIESLDAWKSLENAVKANKGTTAKWSSRPDAEVIYHWRAAYPVTTLTGRNEYIAGIGVAIVEDEPLFALRVYTQMNMRFSGINGAEFRSEMDDLPHGDDSGWVQEGVVRHLVRYSDSPNGLEDLMKKTMGVATEHLSFVKRIFLELPAPDSSED